jgi:hypothetical protein
LLSRLHNGSSDDVKGGIELLYIICVWLYKKRNNQSMRDILKSE